MVAIILNGWAGQLQWFLSSTPLGVTGRTLLISILLPSLFFNKISGRNPRQRIIAANHGGVQNGHDCGNTLDGVVSWLLIVPETCKVYLKDRYPLRQLHMLFEVKSVHTCIPSHRLKRSSHSCPRRVNVGNKNTPSMHHPRRQNVTNSMVGLKRQTNQ